MAAASDESISVALAALTGSAPSVSVLESLTSQEKDQKAQRRHVQKLIKKEKRRLKNLGKRLNKVDPAEVLLYLQGRLAAPPTGAPTASS